MSATPSVPPTKAKKPTVKEQRAAERQRKLEEFRLREAKSRRNRRIAIWGGSIAAAVVVGLLITSIVLTPQAAKYSAGGEGATVEGVETFENTSNHVEGVVDYPQTPPTGGEHNPAWLNCGVYDQPVPNENAVHSLEHGAIWVTYDPSLSDADLETLKSQLPSTYIVLSPFDDLPSPIVLSGWNTQLQVEDADDPRIPEFLEEYWQSQNVPEPGALCTGAIDAPGKVS